MAKTTLDAVIKTEAEAADIVKKAQEKAEALIADAKLEARQLRSGAGKGAAENSKQILAAAEKEAEKIKAAAAGELQEEIAKLNAFADTLQAQAADEVLKKLLDA